MVARKKSDSQKVEEEELLNPDVLMLNETFYSEDEETVFDWLTMDGKLTLNVSEKDIYVFLMISSV